MQLNVESSKVSRVCLVFIAAVLLVLVLKTLQSFLQPFFVAVLLSFLMIPPLRWSKRMKIPLWIFLLGTISCMVLVFGAVALLLVQEQGQLQELVTQSKDSASMYQELFSDLSIGGRSVPEILQQVQLGEVMSNVGKQLLGIIGTLFSQISLVLLFLVFIIPSHELFLKKLRKTLPRAQAKKFNATITKIENSIQDYLWIKGLVSIGTALVSAAILYLFGAKLVFILAILIFTLNFIPTVGSLLAVLVALLAFALTSGISSSLLWLAAFLLAVQLLFGNLIEPKLAGEKLKLSPLIIL